ncbi:Succinyl-diaminopimelate desuccinylase [bacterium YEK0313]|nr:Succinyl-diaminopimelate desuccinylase [bacterium YEK0313]
MTRAAAISAAEKTFDDGRLKAIFARRIAIPTESQNPDRGPDLARYLTEEMQPCLEALGFTCTILTHPKAKAPFLLAERIEDPTLVTVLGYGHGDVIRGLEGQWKDGRDPWTLDDTGTRWYGRGVVDNKGQHTINIEALRCVLETRGKLGFNVRYLIEMGEEVGSAGLHDLARDHADLFKADILIASDGPRLVAERPTLYLGSRGGASIDLSIDAREGGHHSGNWGGLLSNPAIRLAHAIATIVGPKGEVRVHELLPKEMPASVKRALADVEPVSGPGDPEIEPWWGEPGFSAAEKLYGWNTFEVLAFGSGNADKPVNAVPPSAVARCQIRFVVGSDPAGFIPAIRRHLDRHGFSDVVVAPSRDAMFHATRTDPDHPWVRWAATSVEQTTGIKPAVLPNAGGSLPNDVFADILGMPTIWVPHSYPGCSQHAPNEHVPVALLRQAMAMMAGLYWDLGEGTHPKAAR